MKNQTKYALQFNPAPYSNLLITCWLETLEGHDLLGFNYTDSEGDQWVIYQDGVEPINSATSYLASFQLFKTGYKAIVVRKKRN